MKPLDRLLFIYTSLLVTFLTVGALASAPQNLSNLLILVFLLPMAGYVGFQIYIIIYRRRHPLQKPVKTTEATRLKLVNLPQKQGFLHQTGPAFLVTISLFTMLLTATIFRSLINPPLTQSAQIISPQPNSH